MKSNFGILTFSLLAGLPPNFDVTKTRELFPLTDFYDTPESFSTTGKPGDLIRSMKFDGYNLPKGQEMTDNK